MQSTADARTLLNGWNSRSAGNSRCLIAGFRAASSSIQASLTVSQTSRVKAVRTVRALLRALCITEITLAELVLSRSRKSMTAAPVTAEWDSLKLLRAPAVASTDTHSSSSPDERVSAMRRPVSSILAVFSERSMLRNSQKRPLAFCPA